MIGLLILLLEVLTWVFTIVCLFVFFEAPNDSWLGGIMLILVIASIIGRESLHHYGKRLQEALERQRDN